MKILVTGAGGLLGSAVVSLATHKHEVYAAFNQHPPPDGAPVKLDLLHKEEIRTVVKKLMPEAVVHSAALTDVDRCERERDLADKVNHEATMVLSDSANKVGAYFLYVSTDYVFDGVRGMYTEQDPTNPISYYGLTKLRGEKSVRSSGAEFCIARGSVVYGARPAAGKVNFALWLIGKLRNGEHVKVLKDQYVSPTLNISFAKMILEAIERRVAGTLHLAGASRVSRYEFAMALADTFDLDGSLIEAALMKDMQWLATRPRDSSLDVSKASSILNEKPLLLADALLKLKDALSNTGA